MRTMIDLKSLIIGVLATALFFTVIGVKNRNNAKLTKKRKLLVLKRKSNHRQVKKF